MEDIILFNKKYMSDRSLSKKDLYARKKWYKVLLDDEKTYCSYSVRNNSVEKLITSKLEVLTVQQEIVSPSFYFKTIPTVKELKDELISIFSFYPDIGALLIPISVESKDIGKKLKKLGLYVDATQLLGNVKDALRYLKSRCNFESFTVKTANYNKDIKRIMEIEVAAHNADSSSLLSFKKNKKAIIKKIRGFHLLTEFFILLIK
jgi:hypothetical protein